MPRDDYEDRDLAWLRAEARNRKIPGWATASRDRLIDRLIEHDAADGTAGVVVDARERFGGGSRDVLADSIAGRPAAPVGAVVEDVSAAVETARSLLVERDALRAVVDADTALDEAQRILDETRKRWKVRVDDAQESLRVAIEAGRSIDDLGARAAREKLAAIEVAWQHLSEEQAGRKIALMEARAAVEAAGGRRATAISESKQLRFDF